MSDQLQADQANQVSLELVLKLVQEQTKESKELRKEVSNLNTKINEMQDILNKLFEKDKVRRSSSGSKSLDEYRNEKHFVISPRDLNHVKRRSTDSKLIYRHEKSESH